MKIGQKLILVFIAIASLVVVVGAIATGCNAGTGDSTKAGIISSFVILLAAIVPGYFFCRRKFRRLLEERVQQHIAELSSANAEPEEETSP